MTNSIFDCNDARLHTLPDAPTFRVATHEQLVEHRYKLEALNADKIAPRFGTDPDGPDEEYAECRFFENGCHGMLEHEDRWQQCNLIWAWIDERPVWLSPVDWYLDILPDPGRPTRRSFRFSLLGGGQITVLEQFELWRLTPTLRPELHRNGCDLRVTADSGSGLRRFTGVVDSTGCEMYARAALFLPGTPQSVAGRVAATFRLLYTGPHPTVRGPDPDNFMALLDRSSQRCVCGRALRDHVSTLLGIGPDCAKQMRLPHNLETANRILKRRKELLGDHAELAQ